MRNDCVFHKNLLWREHFEKKYFGVFLLCLSVFLKKVSVSQKIVHMYILRHLEAEFFQFKSHLNEEFQ